MSEPGVETNALEPARCAQHPDLNCVDPENPQDHAPGEPSAPKELSQELGAVQQALQSLEINTSSPAEANQAKPVSLATLTGHRRRTAHSRRFRNAPWNTESTNKNTCVACNGGSEKRRREKNEKKGKKQANNSKDQQELVTCPCGDKYCIPCLSQLFSAAMRDERLFPPRCCGKRIRPDSLKPSLPRRVVMAFKEKKQEFETSNRTYCHDPRCSTFVPPHAITNDVAFCIECDEATCALCKEAAHEGECTKDLATEEVLALAEKEGWRRCHRCRQMIELLAGCHHMTCVCGAQFCYACGEPWRTCECLFWRERRLLERADHILDRGKNKSKRIPPGPRRKAEIQRITRSLANNPQCSHGSWKRLSGQFTCEECCHRLPNYILECETCFMQVCQRCSRNRLPAAADDDEE